jgi:3-hydroxymyristoyl/3-hydroxydecanoyl-(acyl carrier protein) dehydratase
VLPHAYPFRLLDAGPGDLRVLVAGNAAGLRGRGELPSVLAIEMLAQAALVRLAAILPGPAPSAGDGVASAMSGAAATAGPRGGLLAGVEGVRFHTPLRAGDRLLAEVELVARLGRLLKVRCALRRDAEVVVEGELLLALE